VGEYLREMEKNKGGGEKGVGRRGKQCSTSGEPHSLPTYEEIGWALYFVACVMAGFGMGWGAFELLSSI